MTQPRKIMTMFVLPTPNSPFEYAYQHVGLVTWPAILLFVWKASKWIERVTTTATKTVEQIDTLATNHMPHMEASLKNQDGLMHEMNVSLKEISQNTGRRRSTDLDGNRL